MKKIERLLQHAPTLEAIQSGKTLTEIKTNWATALADFRQRRERYLIYPP